MPDTHWRGSLLLTAGILSPTASLSLQRQVPFYLFHWPARDHHIVL